MNVYDKEIELLQTTVKHLVSVQAIHDKSIAVLDKTLGKTINILERCLQKQDESTNKNGR
jgi:hypothetical protein